MPRHPSVSVIVPAYNEAGTIEDCLDALLQQTYPRDRYEVLVVDNGSTDGTAAVVESFPVELLSVPEGGQFAARNRGIDRATGDVLAFTDADVRVTDDWIAAGVAAIEALDDRPIVYGLTRPIIDADPTTWTSYDVVHSFGGVRRQTWNLFTTPAVFELVGPFGEQFLSGGDVEWARRAAAHDLEISHDESVVADHPPRDAPGSLARRHVRLGYGDGQRIRTATDDTLPVLIAKEPLRLVDWYHGMARTIAAGSPWLDLTPTDRVACAALVPLFGLCLAYGRLRGLVENSADASVGDYR